jgi:hypothetical protein
LEVNVTSSRECVIMNVGVNRNLGIPSNGEGELLSNK